MAEYSGFFDAQEVTQPDGSKVFDREYFAEHWADYFKLFIGNGVFVSPLNQLKIVAGTGMAVKMLPGWAFIDGYWYHNDSEKIITIPSNASPSDVNYSIHLTLSETAERKIIQEQWISTGALATGQIRLAMIKIKPGATAIYNADITDTRPDENQCGFVKGLVDVIDTNDLFLQFTNMFNTWFDGMKGKLSTDAAGNLQTQINALDATKANQTSLDATNAIVAQKADKSEVTNVMTPKGNIAYASLPANGNTVGWYYYCPDGDGTHGAGNYVWNGTTWYFGGTGDQGYNMLKDDIINNIYSQKVDVVQGYYAIVDGAEIDSTAWCRTKQFINRKYQIESSYRLYVCAFQNGNYIGTWNGNEFVKTFDNTLFIHSIDFYELSKKYKDYQFKIDFYNTGNDLSKESVYSDLKIVDYTEKEIYGCKIMEDVYEFGEISTVGNMYDPNFTGEVTNRARVKRELIQKIPIDATSVTVKISKESIANGKYKVAWGFYTKDFVKIISSVNGWFTTDTEFVQYIPYNAEYFMFYYASDNAKIVISELDNSKNSAVFNNSTRDFAKDLLKANRLDVLEEKMGVLEKRINPNLNKKIANIMSNVMFINHRGFNTIAPENTIIAFEMSANEGFQYVETDVLFTSDNIPVLLHDGTINRTARNADGTELSSDVAIRDIPYAQALTYDFGIWRGDEYKGTKIPTFDEFMALCKTRGLKPFIELKDEIVYTESMVNSIIDIVKKYGMIDNVWFISFSYDNLLMVKNTLPSAKLGLAGGWTATRNEESFMVVINQIKSLRTDINTVAMSGGYQYFNDTFYNLCINNNVPLIMWTVDTKEAYNSLYPCFFAILSNCLSAYDVLS